MKGMTDALRLFVAVEIPRELRDALREIQNALRETERRSRGASLSIPDAGNLHLTLRFLGETPGDLLPSLLDRLDRALGGAHAFELAIRGAGAFPDLLRPRVLWAGVARSERLAALHRAVADGLKGWPAPPDDKPFKPHLTLARVRSASPGSLADAMKPHLTRDFGTFPVREVVLMRSEPGRGGATYTPLRRWPLDPDPSDPRPE